MIAERLSITIPRLICKGPTTGTSPKSTQGKTKETGWFVESFPMRTTTESARAAKRNPVSSTSPCRGSRLPKKIRMINPARGRKRIARARPIIASGELRVGAARSVCGRLLFFHFADFVDIDRVETLIDMQHDRQSDGRFRGRKNDDKDCDRLAVELHPSIPG